MVSASRFNQRGITFFGLIFVAAVLAMAGVVLAQVFPTVLEYMAVTKAVQHASEGKTIEEVRSLFTKEASIDDIKIIKSDDLEVSKEDDRVIVGFAYQREIHLFGPAFLTLKYQGQSK